MGGKTFSFLLIHHPPGCVDELDSIFFRVEGVHGIINKIPPEGSLIFLVENLEIPITLVFLQEIPIGVKRLYTRLLKNHTSSVLCVERIVDLP